MLSIVFIAVRNAGAVIHSHSKSAVMASILAPVAQHFEITHLEMIKVNFDGYIIDFQIFILLEPLTQIQTTVNNVYYFHRGFIIQRKVGIIATMKCYVFRSLRTPRLKKT